MFCIECGQKRELSDRFCSNCGQKIDEFEEPEEPKRIKETHNLESRKSGSKKGVIAEVPSNVRIAPIYGEDFDPKIHCFNCGAKKSSSKNCSICGEVEGRN